ncbi:MAG: tandem-95 repeat protein, partial [Sulfuricella denitrificans]|nr:tandem-95 repeat protein [Sulfuricella denitrificans]
FLANGSVTYTPDANWNGTDSFSYTVTSPAGVTETASVTVNVAAVNDPPVAISTSASGNEDSPVPVTISGTDIDGTVSSFTLSSLPANGRLYMDAGLTQMAPTGSAIAASGNALSLYFVPLANWNGSTAFSYTATDNGGLNSTPATASITVLPVNDGAPVAVNDSFSTLLGTPVVISKAALLANDSLPDHATIVSTGSPSSGSLVDNGNGTYTYTPSAVGTATFTYLLRDDDLQTSSGTVSIRTFNTRDDLATVSESALANGSGGGASVVGGNLLTNDAGNTSISSINGVAAVAGVITVNTTVGTLVVQASGAGAGAYTYTLKAAANNSLPANDANVAETFTYVGNQTTNTLTVTVLDDKPSAMNQTVEVPESVLPGYNLVLVLDVSGSMTSASAGGEVRQDNADGSISVTTRLAMAKDALVSLVNEYYSQAADVSIRLVTFSSTATLDPTTYTTKNSAISAIQAITGSGSTNYEDALNKAKTALDSDGNGIVNDATKSNVVYFISDGMPTAGNTTNPVGASGYSTFVTANGVHSYAVGIGTGLSDVTQLNNIHNVDADGNGVKESAILVPDLNKLDEELISTIPNAFGGNIVTSGNVHSVNFGADGGYISSITVKLDSNADAAPDQSVTFNYNNGSNQITQNSTYLTGFPLAGNLLTLDSSKGFVSGSLVFDFKTGDYTYYTAGQAHQGDKFDIAYVVSDNDGDKASAVQTISVVDGHPVARDDTDTMFAKETKLEGNVVTGLGTDGGLGLGTQVTNFNTQGSGVDTIVDNAKVTSVDFHGVTYNLTSNGSGSGSGYSYVVNAGVLTWTASSGGQQLIFNQNGYYSYTPPAADIPVQVLGTPQTVSLGTAPIASTGLVLTGESVSSATTPHTVVPGVVNYDNTGTGTPDGAGVRPTGSSSTTTGVNSQIDNLEALNISFDPTIHPNGVQSVSLVADASNSNLDSNTSFTYIVYHIDGHEMGQFASNVEGAAVNIPAEFTNVGKITVLASSDTAGSITSISYTSVLTNTAAAPVAPEHVGYTLTDSDGDTSKATLTLNVMANTLVGNSAANTLTGTGGNDYIEGMAGNDVIDGGAGHDIILGGAGNDTITGGSGDDVISGGDGDDNLSGGTGNDVVRGDAGNDTISGGSGNDKLEGGAGNDVINGNTGSDTISGGAGNDTLTGGDAVGLPETDVFVWTLADAGAPGTPAVDTITDFNTASAATGGDVLDLRDLLSGENHTVGTGNLSSYLHFEYTGVDTNTHVSSYGGFSNGFTMSAVDQTIITQGADLVGAATTDQQVIQDLLDKGKLITD